VRGGDAALCKATLNTCSLVDLDVDDSEEKGGICKSEESDVLGKWTPTYGYCSSQCNIATPLRELTCHVGSHSITCQR